MRCTCPSNPVAQLAYSSGRYRQPTGLATRRCRAGVQRAKGEGCRRRRRAAFGIRGRVERRVGKWGPPPPLCHLPCGLVWPCASCAPPPSPACAARSRRSVLPGHALLCPGLVWSAPLSSALLCSAHPVPVLDFCNTTHTTRLSLFRAAPTVGCLLSCPLLPLPSPPCPSPCPVSLPFTPPLSTQSVFNPDCIAAPPRALPPRLLESVRRDAVPKIEN